MIRGRRDAVATQQRELPVRAEEELPDRAHQVLVPSDRDRHELTRGTSDAQTPPAQLWRQARPGALAGRCRQGGQH